MTAPQTTSSADKIAEKIYNFMEFIYMKSGCNPDAKKEVIILMIVQQLGKAKVTYEN